MLADHHPVTHQEEVQNTQTSLDSGQDIVERSEIMQISDLVPVNTVIPEEQGAQHIVYFTKMNLSQVMPSGCNLHRVAVEPTNQLAEPQRPSASSYSEDQSVVDPAAMQMDLAIPEFQPYRGETGRALLASEYGITVDTSSLISSASGTEREDTDEEICSFDLGPEPFDPEDQGRLSADEWLDDFQQGLVPGGSQPRNIDYKKYLAMPKKPSILDMMRQDIADNDEDVPTSPERALTPTIGFSYD